MNRRVLRVDGRDNFEEVGEGYESWNKAIDARVGQLVVCPGGKVELWCDEEGLCKGEPILNFTASIMARQHIVGDVIVFRKGDVK